MTLSFINRLKSCICRHSMITRGDRVLVGLSGGADSVALLTSLSKINEELNFELAAAYIDHGLRPDEIPAEIDFCKGLCQKLGVSFFTATITPAEYAGQEGLSLQEACRELRHEALQKIALDDVCNKIALAHNADDQAETIIMHLIRGAGPLGLAGMPAIRKPFIRPLIETTRSEIEAFISGEGTGHVTDSSNMKDDYLRNRIRHFLVPAINNINPDFIHTISRTADIIRQEERYLDIQTTKTLMKLISRKTDTTIQLFLLPMETLDIAILRRVLRRAISETRSLRRLGHVHIEDIAKLVKNSQSGSRIYLPNDIRAIKSYSTLILTSDAPTKIADYSVSGDSELVIKESGQVIKFSLLDRGEVADFGDGRKFTFLNADNMVFPLKIRSRAAGDSIYPLGLGKRKKLQDLFVDQKIPRDERDSVPLLLNGEEIACVIGYRVDERYKVSDNTERVLCIEIKPLKI